MAFLSAGDAAASAAANAASAWSADEALTQLYATHYRPLVRLAVLLLHDAGAAEEITQDSYVAMHRHWGRLRDPGKAVAYLRQSVVNRARSALRHRAVVARFLGRQAAPVPAASAEAFALAAETFSEVVAALRLLPVRQREVLVLRYYGELSEAEIAATMGVSRGAVKSHASRALAAMRRAMEEFR